ncbi:CobW/P47K family protein [Oribacterium sp. oral taxon 078 str. F0263]|uniref:GTP-binding protein n=1 Tax=Oribacterium sp. oral taxon 078 TaxID=652706 RepID=UPI0003AE3909|nr:CobW family GTP-binding protein [Oribacterium sp. oral taxon 078]ERL21724.1 CobW/P47K family protein [Oribacterium sp. oral taxon 078 str. F0263]
MTKIDIISGFLGAGKTSFIRKLLSEALKGEKVVLIENEFGEIGIDGGFLKDSGIEIREMNQGCICCSLVGDFESSLREVAEKFKPDRIIIEPSGVGKLSDIIGAVKSASKNMEVELHAAVTIVDAKKAKLYSKNFGEFFDNQIRYAAAVVLSRTDIAPEDKIQEAVEIVRERNPKAVLVTTPLDKLDGGRLMELISKPDDMEEELLREAMERVREHEERQREEEEHEGHAHCHHHHHGEDSEACEGGHSHHEGECCGHHHHGEDSEAWEEGHSHHEGECCAHHHHHEEEAENGQGSGEDGLRVHRHHHHHHHGEEHDADEIFTSWGLETAKAYDRAWLEALLSDMAESEKFGNVIRAKGMLPAPDGSWLYFDLVPGQTEIREGAPEYTGKVVVIGEKLKEELLEKSFREAGSAH